MASLQPLQGSRTGGFTVVEVIMVLSLLAAVLALLVVNFFAFDGAFSRRPALDQVQRAVAEAHRLARSEGIPVRLSFDASAGALTLHDSDGTLLKDFPFPSGVEADVRFYPIRPERAFEQNPFFEPDEHPVTAIRFLPFGASLPFAIQVGLGDRAASLRFDPFSALSWQQSDAH
jgi:type II secretory pathway pseudopilin PulG